MKVRSPALAVAAAVLLALLAASCGGEGGGDPPLDFRDYLEEPGQTDQSGEESDDRGSSSNSTRLGTTQASYTLEDGDCYIRNNNSRNRDDKFYVTPCDEAEERVVEVVALKDGPWPGVTGMDRAANDYCPPGTDKYFAATELDWALDDRYIVCREVLRR